MKSAEHAHLLLLASRSILREIIDHMHAVCDTTMSEYSSIYDTVQQAESLIEMIEKD